MNMDAPWWYTTDAQRTIGQELRRTRAHLLIKFTMNGQDHAYLASGFILAYRDRHLWCTAGHVVKNELDRLATDPNVHIQSSRLIDSPHFDGIAKGLQVSFPDVKMFAFDYDDSHPDPFFRGFDFGCIQLEPLALAGLRNNPSFEPAVLGKELIKHSAEAEVYFVLGVPGGNRGYVQSLAPIEPELVTYTEVLLPLMRLEPSDENWRRFPNAFHGRLDSLNIADAQPLTTLKGMSGGPVFGVKLNEDKFTVGFVGIQHVWMEETNRIIATSAEQIMRFLDLALDDPHAFSLLTGT